MQIERTTDLGKLSEFITAEHDKLTRSMSESVTRACRVGDALIRAKDLVPRGKWSEWLEANAPFSDRTARQLMDVARNADQLTGERTYRDAVKSLAEMRAPERKSLPEKKPHRQHVAVSPETENPDVADVSFEDGPKAPEPAEKTSPPQKPESIVQDHRGTVVPEELEPVFSGELDELWREVKAAADTVYRLMKQLRETPAGHWIDQARLDDAKRAKTAVRFSRPFAVLPDGAEELSDLAAKYGYVPRAQFDKLPEAMKK